MAGTLRFDNTNMGHTTINGGTLRALGDIIVADGFNYGGTTILLINGTGAQLFSGAAIQSSGTVLPVDINKPSGTLTLSGTIRTNTQDAAVLVAQSREIGRLTALLLDIYAGRHPPVRWHDGLSVMLHAEGRPVPFGVTAHPAASPVRYDGERAALLVRVGPPREPGVQGYDFMAWVTSFADLSRRRGDPELQRLSALAVCDSPVPLAVDFDLAVGCVRGALVAVAATNLPGSGWAAGGD